MFLVVFTVSRLFAVLASMCFSGSIFRPDVVIFSSLLFTAVGSGLFVASQGVIDFSEVIHAATSYYDRTVHVRSPGTNTSVGTSGGGIALWLGVVMQAVSVLRMTITYNDCWIVYF